MTRNYTRRCHLPHSTESKAKLTSSHRTRKNPPPVPGQAGQHRYQISSCRYQVERFPDLRLGTCRKAGHLMKHQQLSAVLWNVHRRSIITQEPVIQPLINKAFLTKSSASTLFKTPATGCSSGIREAVARSKTSRKPAESPLTNPMSLEATFISLASFPRPGESSSRTGSEAGPYMKRASSHVALRTSD